MKHKKKTKLYLGVSQVHDLPHEINLIIKDRRYKIVCFGKICFIKDQDGNQELLSYFENKVMKDLENVLFVQFKIDWDKKTVTFKT